MSQRFDHAASAGLIPTPPDNFIPEARRIALPQ